MGRGKGWAVGRERSSGSNVGRRSERETGRRRERPERWHAGRQRGERRGDGHRRGDTRADAGRVPAVLCRRADGDVVVPCAGSEQAGGRGCSPCLRQPCPACNIAGVPEPNLPSSGSGDHCRGTRRRWWPQEGHRRGIAWCAGQRLLPQGMSPKCLCFCSSCSDPETPQFPGVAAPGPGRPAAREPQLSCCSPGIIPAGRGRTWSSGVVQLLVVMQQGSEKRSGSCGCGSSFTVNHSHKHGSLQVIYGHQRPSELGRAWSTGGWRKGMETHGNLKCCREGKEKEVIERTRAWAVLLSFADLAAPQLVVNLGGG